MMSSSSNNNDADTENELTTTTTTTGLRQRKGGSSTATATANGNTLRNGTHNTSNDNNNTSNDNNNTSNDNNNSDNYNVGPRKAMSDIEVKKDEKRLQKILIRAISGLTLIIFFMICVYLGHLYVCGLVALSEFLLFRELVKVRYNTFYKSRIQNTIPLFRTTQWLWFNVAIFYTYSDFISGRVIENNMHLHYLLKYTNPYFNIVLPFLLYSITFVITITTFKQGHIKFQLNQLCWTIVVLCLTVGQMKYIMHNIFNGLFWFTFPFLLVVCNDVMAYFVGISIGRKFIKRSFMVVSPNKTWEGFIGGGICTMIFAWYFSRFLAHYTWMVCPVNDFELFPSTLKCDEDGTIHHIFQEAQSIFPDQIFDIFPNSIVKMIPGIVEICRNVTAAAAGGGGGGGSGEVVLTRCILSGDEVGGSTQEMVFHHFELIWKDVYPIQIHALWLGFFASVVGPFGGFLASAIKRAYGIKDFDSIIPGHGGITDRLDCQFLMALCTWVHYNSFCKLTTISVPKLIYHYNMMTYQEKKQFLEAIVPTAATVSSIGGVDSGNELLKQFQDYALS